MSVPEKKSAEERRAALAQQVQMSVAQGRRVESQGDYRAVLVHKRLGLLDRREVVEVDEYGNVTIQRL